MKFAFLIADEMFFFPENQCKSKKLEFKPKKANFIDKIMVRKKKKNDQHINMSTFKGAQLKCLANFFSLSLEKRSLNGLGLLSEEKQLKHNYGVMVRLIVLNKGIVFERRKCAYINQLT